MGEKDELLRGLEAGVAAEPGNVSLRLHLGSMLIDAGRASEGLDHCEVVLRGDPGNDRAVELAARARRLIGEPFEPVRVSADDRDVSVPELSGLGRSCRAEQPTAA